MLGSVTARNYVHKYVDKYVDKYVNMLSTLGC